MLKFLFLGLLTLSVSAEADSSGNAAAERLTDVLRGEEVVAFYFVSRTGSYVLRGDRFKEEATTTVIRRCGANCHNFMREVIDHLHNSAEVVCEPGQENLLIETGTGVLITYSHSGRSIEWSGKCYFNETGLDRVVKNSTFLFN